MKSEETQKEKFKELYNLLDKHNEQGELTENEKKRVNELCDWFNNKGISDEKLIEAINDKYHKQTFQEAFDEISRCF